LPWVHYPNHYGTFPAFGENVGEIPALCICATGAVINYLRLRKLVRMGTYSDGRVAAPLSSHTFPNGLADESLRRKSSPMKWLRFESKVCHRCNLVTPSLRWCVETYGGRFRQYFGWYIRETMYRYGVAPMSYVYLHDVCPDELIQLIEDARNAAHKAETERQRLMDMSSGPSRSDIAPEETTYWHNVKLEEAELYQRLQWASSRLKRKLDNYFENITREEFGFRKIGDAYIGESLLFKIVRRLFPDDEVIRHHRPAWLQGLEIDIYLPRRKLGLEYQGQQHFHAITAWGGESALVELQHRDVKKRKLCHERGVKLIAVDYAEPLTEPHISERVRSQAYTWART